MLARKAPVWIALAMVIGVSTAVGDVYRWIDAQGRVHFGDKPPADARTSSLDLPERRPWRKVTVKTISDGDTLRLSTGERVRLLNIDTPEIANRGRPAEAFADAAKTLLERLLAGQSVEIRAGEQRRDKYGRTLALVRTPDAGNVAIRILEEGLAHLDIRAPNDADWQHYADAERRAREQGLGIWSLPDFEVHDSSVAARRQNLFTRVEGTPAEISSGRKGTAFSLGALSVFIPEEYTAVAEWLRSLEPATRVVLRGQIRSRDRQPTLYLRHMSQIESD